MRFFLLYELYVVARKDSRLTGSERSAFEPSVLAFLANGVMVAFS